MSTKLKSFIQKSHGTVRLILSRNEVNVKTAYSVGRILIYVNISRTESNKKAYHTSVE